MSTADDALTVPCEGIGIWPGAMLVTPLGRRFVAPVDGCSERGAWNVVGVSFYAINLLRLDLTHRPTRLEMRLRLAEHMGYIGTIAAVVPRDADWWLDMLGAAWSRLDMPALADLDPTDDTRLPDGARMVDVRALAIVLRYVFGVPR